MTHSGKLGSPRCSRGSSCHERVFWSWPHSPRRGDGWASKAAALATVQPHEAT